MEAKNTVRIPNLGDFDAVLVIEVPVKAGDKVNEGDTLVTLESEKATMEVPSPTAGVVQEVLVKVGDKVSEGTPILTLAAEDVAAPAPQADAPPAGGTPHAASHAPAGLAPEAWDLSRAEEDSGPASRTSSASVLSGEPHRRGAHAGPSVRRFARELGVDLEQVHGTGPLGRILQEDVRGYIRSELARPRASGALAAGTPETELHLAPWPSLDFGKYGPTESRPLSRIRKITGENLHRNWVMIPHVTNHEEADITGLEAHRARMNGERGKADPKVTLLAFLIETAVASLKAFPEFNASLDQWNLILKRYYHIGFAADTAEGLVVPVIRDADRKSVVEIAREVEELSSRARKGSLSPADMQGGCFTISSLGGIGGTYFTPILRAPEVAILGVCRASIRPVWDGKQFAPRRILPLSLSWDHRVLDGAAATRFCAFFAQRLADRAPESSSPQVSSGPTEP